MSELKISCVIVTYNRLKLLKKVYLAVLNQTTPSSEIIIVDNHSTDGTREYLQDLEKANPQVKHLRLPQNTGGAGGFHYGIKSAYHSEADWIWVLDDDAVPKHNALEKLIHSDIFNYYQHSELPKEELGFLSSRVEWTDGAPCYMNIQRVARDWPALHNLIPSCLKLYSASFVSLLINKRAVEKCGFPVKEFFIWYDDVEYTSRISEVMPGYYVPESRIVHHTKENMRPMDLNHLNNSTLWKFKYGLRNEIAVLAKEDQGFPKALLFLVRRCYLMLLAKIPFSIIFKMVKSGISGILFNYKRHIEYPTE